MVIIASQLYEKVFKYDAGTINTACVKELQDSINNVSGIYDYFSENEDGAFAKAGNWLHQYINKQISL